jgi:hypothetical protein
MNFRTRFILLALFNCGNIALTLWLSSRYNLDLSKRLIDLNIDTTRGVTILLAFIATVLVGFLVNFILLSSRKSEFTYEQVASLLANHS